MKAIQTILLLAILTLMSSCGEDDNRYDADLGYEQTMINFMDTEGWEGIQTLEGMYYVIDEPGGAEKPTLSSIVNMKYRGYYSDGTEFDASNDFSFRLNQLIRGWQVGIPKFGAGGKGHLLIPPSLGYGEFPNNGVRNQSILIFDIELVSF